MPFVYHEHRTPISFGELRNLYIGCRVVGETQGFVIELPDSKTVLTIPFRAIEREHGEHYLPFEEVLRKDVQPLRPYGYAIPQLFARHFGLKGTEYGIVPCDIGASGDCMLIEVAEIDTFGSDARNPEYLMLYTKAEPGSIVADRNVIYRGIRINNNDITMIAIPICRAAEICWMDEEELLDLLRDAYSCVQEAEWHIAQLPNR